VTRVRSPSEHSVEDMVHARQIIGLWAASLCLRLEFGGNSWCFGPSLETLSGPDELSLSTGEK
jgi:hypothetical protein